MNIKNIICKTLVGIAALGFASCTEKIDESNLYTFTGETINDYLTNRNDRFSSFNYILSRSGYDKVLSAYGTFTCFAPTNEAVAWYIDSLYRDTTSYVIIKQDTIPFHNSMTENSLAGLSDSLCKDIAKFHLSNTEYLSTDMQDGTSIMTMLDREVNTGLDSISASVVINSYSKIIKADQELENGVVHEIDQVIRRSNRLMAGEFERHSEFSIFYTALKETGLIDSLGKTGKTQLDPIADTQGYWVPEHKYGYTIFAETDEVFNQYGIKNFPDLVKYANEVYEHCADPTTGWYDFYRNNGITVSTGSDYTSPYNAVNMFVRYHLLKQAVPRSRLVYSWNEISSYPLFEYNETMLPYTLMKVVKRGNVYSINRQQKNSTLTDRVLLQGSASMCPVIREGIRILQLKSGNDLVELSALNGYIHPIDSILTYAEWVPKGVLNERLRFETTSLMPAMMSTGIRGMTQAQVREKQTETTDYGRVRFPANFFDNLKVYNGDNTMLRYLTKDEGNYNNYQGDEFLCVSAFDFAFRLPPVPDGTYELRIGYTANGNRTMVQFYLGNDSTRASMKSIDIPIDQRIQANNPLIGWTLYTEEADNGLASDKEMRNRGYMRGVLSFTLGKGGSTVSRANQQGIRRILTRQEFKQGEYWLRCKNLLTGSTSEQFHMDYIELCPAQVYNNINYLEDMF